MIIQEGKTVEKRIKEMSEQEIFWKIISGWRHIVILGLVMSIFMTGFFYLKDMKLYNQKIEEKDKNTEEEECKKNFSEAEKEQFVSVQQLQKLIDDRNMYINNSLIMNIDASNENALVMTWQVIRDSQNNYIAGRDGDYIETIVAAYTDYVQSGKLGQKLSEKLEFDAKYVKELTSISSSFGSGVFSIEMIYPDQDELYDMAEIIKSEIEQERKLISQNIKEHSLMSLTESIVIRTDAELALYQKEVYDELKVYQERLNTITKEMSPEQLEILSTDETIEETIIKPEVHIKHIVFGFVLGIFLGIVWRICRVLFSATLQNGEELERVYDIKLLGIIENQKGSSGIDRWFKRISNKRHMSEKDKFDMAISNIVVACQKEKCNKIYLTGSNIGKIEKEICNEIINKLDEEEINVVYGEDICYVAESYREMADVGFAIILEQEGVSVCQEIEKEIKSIVGQGTKLLGGVVIRAIL